MVYSKRNKNWRLLKWVIRLNEGVSFKYLNDILFSAKGVYKIQS